MSQFFSNSPSRNISRAVPAKEIGGLQSKAKSVLRETLLPSFQDLGNYLETKYSRHLRTQPGMVGMVNGTDMYKVKMKQEIRT